MSSTGFVMTSKDIPTMSWLPIVRNPTFSYATTEQINSIWAAKILLLSFVLLFYVILLKLLYYAIILYYIIACILTVALFGVSTELITRITHTHITTSCIYTWVRTASIVRFTFIYIYIIEKSLLLSLYNEYSCTTNTVLMRKLLFWSYPLLHIR